MPWGFYVAVAILAGAVVHMAAFWVRAFWPDVPSPFHDDTGR